LGINIRDDDAVVFRNFTYFAFSSQTFETMVINDAQNRQHFFDIKKTIKSQLLAYGFTHGIDIDIFSENEKDS